MFVAQVYTVNIIFNKNSDSWLCVIAFSTKNILAAKKERPETKKRLLSKRCEIKMGSQGLCSVTADGNKVLIITSQATKH